MRIFRRLSASAFAGVLLTAIAVHAGSPAVEAVAGPDAAAYPSELSPLKLIPWPKSVTIGKGALAIHHQTHIAAADLKLKRLAEILSDEIRLTTGLQLTVIDGNDRAGDIVLRIDPQLRGGSDILTVRDRKVIKVRDYAHHIVVNDRVLVEGWDYRAVAEGTATLLQLLTAGADPVSVPAVEILDWPQADFMGAMVDTARQYNSIEHLRQMVLLCRTYKVRYLDLHLTDDQSWTFPSTKYPQLGATGPRTTRYDLAELKALIRFADERGVTLVPKIEMPGHSGAARGTLPEVFGYIDPATRKTRDQGMMNITNPRLYEALDTLIGEATALFASSPYFDMGFDEVSGLNEIMATPEGKAFMKEKGLANGSELVNYFAQTVNEMVKKRGKKALLWEGPASFVSPDIIVFAWDGNSRQAEQMQAKGITTITVPWSLGVPWPQWSMFVCNGSMLKPTDAVLGAALPAWEQRGEVHVRWLRALPNRQERTWGPRNLFTETGFKQRLTSTDAVADRLLYGFSVLHDHALDNADHFRISLARSARLTLSPATGIGAVRFTIDGSEPTVKSPILDAPYTIEDSQTINARLFDPAGKPLAAMWSQPYEFDPLSFRAAGLSKDVKGNQTHWFAAGADVTLASATAGGSIHFTTDGTPPVVESSAYGAPIKLNKTSTLRARWFDAQRKPRGKELSEEFYRLAGVTGAAVGKPVTLLVPEKIEGKAQIEHLLTNGLQIPGDDWQSPEVAHFGGSDMTAVIDLQSPTKLVTVGGRFLYMQEIGIFPPPTMDVSISDDGKKYTPLGQAHFTSPANPQDRGMTVKTLRVNGANATARYVKVHAKNIGLTPEWHPAKGAPAHLMCDEIFVNPLDDGAVGSK